MTCLLNNLLMHAQQFEKPNNFSPREYHSPSSQCFGLLDIFVIEIYSMIYIYIYIFVTFGDTL